MAVTGSAPLSYQWSLNTTNIAGATNTFLLLTNVQYAQAGDYAVEISNGAGATNSMPASLTVMPAPACDPTPSGIAAWWQAEGNASDLITGSNGLVASGAGFAAGIVGQCFSFDGISGCILNDNTPSLTSIQNSFTMEFWAFPQEATVLYPVNPGALYNGGGLKLAIFPEFGGSSGPAGAGVSVGTNGISVFEHAYNYLPCLLDYTNSLSGWVHVAVVYANKQPTLYVNGVNVATGITSPRSSVYPSKDFGGSIASPWNTYGQYAGLLDEISIYDRALAPTEIAAIYAAGSAGKCFQPTPPVITAQPASQTNALGTTATFTVTAGGSAPMSFQWSFNGTNLNSATNTTLTLSNVQFSQAGTYSVLVSNAAGSTNSASATLSVYAFPPFIAVQPVSSSSQLGSTTEFQVTATGTAPLSYQWSFNGTNLSDATNAILLFTNVQLNEAGSYAVQIANAAGSTNSASASLTVYTLPPYITAQPASQIVIVGTTATFTVATTGTTPFSFQWSLNNSNILGATNATLTITNVQFNQAGNYAVQIANVAGSTNSAAVSLTVNSLPPCDPAPAGLIGWWQAEGTAWDAISGSNGVIKPGTSFTNGMVGQCFSFDGGNGCIMNTNTPPLTNVQNSFTIEFWAYPTKSFIFQPEGGGLGISGQSYVTFPEYGNTTGGAGAGVSVGTNGISVLEHAAGYLPSLLSYTNPIVGWTHIAVVYSNKQPTLYVNGIHVRTGLTSAKNFVFPGKNLGSSYGSSGAQYKTYGPYKGLVDEVSIYNRALGSNEIASLYSAGSAGKCPAPPTITSQPVSLTNLAGATATFKVTASGMASFVYQWSFNSVNIGSATNAVLTLTNIQPNQAGSYEVLVSNGGGATNSASATLTVVVPPVITQQPQSQTVLSFNSTAFAVAAIGTGPLTFQWQLNGTNLVDNGNVTGSATTSLTLASVSVRDAGNYDVVVSSPYATTNSATAILTVPETTLSMASTNALSGSTITLPISMNALGVENTFVGSVGYDPTKLAVNHVQLGQATVGAYLQEIDTQTNNGFVGFAILLSYGSTIPAGTQEVAEVVFQALPVTNNTTVNLTFGDTPSALQVVDNNLNLLPAVYQGGSILLTPAEYAADVYPRFNGDHQLTLQDWLEEGRMVAGLDTPTNADEFLRADCAPRNAPDGVLTVADWVQAGRYALGLDPITLVAPPAAPHLMAKGQPKGGPATTRILQVANVSAQRGQSLTVPIQLVGTTNENAVGMTVSYNPNQLRLAGVSGGSALTSGRLIINSNQLTGKVGLALALSTGATLPAGTNQLALLQFVASTNTSGTVALTLDDSVVKLQVADLLANSLAATYVNGSVTLPAPPAVAITGTGGNLQLSWPVASGAFQVQMAAGLAGPWTTITSPISTNGANAAVTVSPTNQQQYFRLQGQ